MSEWISVKDHPIPEDAGAILVYLAEPMSWSRVHGAVYHPQVTCIGGRFEFDAPEVTHWMPLPAPPEQPERVDG